MSKKVGWSFWWLWLFANIIGSALLPTIVWQEPYDLRSRFFINGMLQSIGISLAQSVVLRDLFAKEGWWMPLTLFGWLLGLIVVFFVPALSMRSLPNLSLTNLSLATILLIDFAIIGGIVGICQWQLLKTFRAAGLWLFANAIALSLSTFGLLLGYIANSTLLASVLQGAIYGAISGLAALKVLRSPKIFPKNRK